MTNIISYATVGISDTLYAVVDSKVVKVTIILTDYPKLKTINANLRGIPTERLVEVYKQLFHTMTDVWTETAAGYLIEYNSTQIEKELKYRKVEKIPYAR